MPFKDPEKRRQADRAYKARNRAEILQKKKDYREAHKEEISEYLKGWRAANPEYAKTYYRDVFKKRVNDV